MSQQIKRDVNTVENTSIKSDKILLHLLTQTALKTIPSAESQSQQAHEKYNGSCLRLGGRRMGKEVQKDGC